MPKVVVADNAVKCGELMESLVGEDMFADVWKSFSMAFDTSTFTVAPFSTASS